MTRHEPPEASAPDTDSASDETLELKCLVGAFRSHLDWLAGQGCAYLPAGLSARAGIAARPGAASAREGALDLAGPGDQAEALDPTARALNNPPPGAAGLALIREVLGDCTRCRLAQGRIQIVFGQGNPDADLMFVGEAPGRDEDLAGEAFVGAAGALLTRMIQAMRLTREQVFIANVIKCRPPRNRDPEPDEVAVCEPFLLAQIRAIQPRVLVTLGRHAAQTLLQSDAAISRLRGRFHQLRLGDLRIPLMPTYHPAYLLRNEEAKRPVWEDLKQVMGHLGTSRDRASP